MNVQYPPSHSIFTHAFSLKTKYLTTLYPASVQWADLWNLMAYITRGESELMNAIL